MMSLNRKKKSAISSWNPAIILIDNNEHLFTASQRNYQRSPKKRHELNKQVILETLSYLKW